MRFGILLATLITVFFPGALLAAQPERTTVELGSPYSLTVSPGVPLKESDKRVHGISLTAKVDGKGEGSGSLELNPSYPTFNEVGYFMGSFGVPAVKLDCTVKFVKKTSVMVRTGPRLGSDEKEVDWLLFEIRGPKITSQLYLATPLATKWKSGRILVHDRDGQVQYVVDVNEPDRRPREPCHPGCFPASTLIHVPGGTKPIEDVHAGDFVTLVAPNGALSQGKVAAVFVTHNRLLRVHTDAGDLITTQTQPLSLADGGLREAGALNAGNRIFRWEGNTRRAATVRSVSATGREDRVFNLILSDGAIFVANCFLARSKPPAPQP